MTIIIRAPDFKIGCPRFVCFEPSKVGLASPRHFQAYVWLLSEKVNSSCPFALDTHFVEIAPEALAAAPLSPWC